MKNDVKGEGEVEGKGGGRTRDWGRYDPGRLPAYQRAREHTRAIAELLATADTRGYSDLVNQTRRSTASITGNIKEGYGADSPGQKAHYYSIAKASVSETWGHVDNLVDFGCVPESEIGLARDLENQLIALLTTMIRTQQARVE